MASYKIYDIGSTKLNILIQLSQNANNKENTKKQISCLGRTVKPIAKAKEAKDAMTLLS